VCTVILFILFNTSAGLSLAAKLAYSLVAREEIFEIDISCSQCKAKQIDIPRRIATTVWAAMTLCTVPKSRSMPLALTTKKIIF
jgi:hypothetical protein